MHFKAAWGGDGHVVSSCFLMLSTYSLLDCLQFFFGPVGYTKPTRVSVTLHKVAATNLVCTERKCDRILQKILIALSVLKVDSRNVFAVSEVLMAK